MLIPMWIKAVVILIMALGLMILSVIWSDKRNLISFHNDADEDDKRQYQQLSTALGVGILITFAVAAFFCQY